MANATPKFAPPAALTAVTITIDVDGENSQLTLGAFAAQLNEVVAAGFGDWHFNGSTWLPWSRAEVQISRFESS